MTDFDGGKDWKMTKGKSNAVSDLDDWRSWSKGEELGKTRRVRVLIAQAMDRLGTPFLSDEEIEFASRDYLGDLTKKSNSYWEVGKGSDGRWFWRFRSASGKILARGEKTYKERGQAVRAYLNLEDEVTCKERFPDFRECKK